MQKPNIFKNNNLQTIDHNKKYCYLEEENNSIEEVLDELFNGKGYSYNKPVIIKTKEKKWDTYIVAKTKKTVITLENEIIKISDIISLERKKD